MCNRPTQNAFQVTEKLGSNTNSNSEDTMLYFKIRLQREQRKINHNLDFALKLAASVLHLIYKRIFPVSVRASQHHLFFIKLISLIFLNGTDMKRKLNLLASGHMLTKSKPGFST